MNKAVVDLLVVQDRDSKIASLLNDLKKVPVDKQRINMLKAARETEFKKAKAAVQETELAMRAVEGDVATRRVTIGRLKTQQFETRKNEEYQTFGKEIIRYEQEVDALETRELELMEELDERRKLQEVAQEKWQTVLKGIDAELDKCDQRAARLEVALAELKVDRQKLAEKLDDSILDRYERMKKSKGLPVVVLMSDIGDCGGCHTKVIRITENAVREGRDIVECENCGRILH